MPSTSIDTFFACTIIIAAALISTAFLTSNLQTTINSTGDVNKETYLKAIADRIVTSSGSPVDWGTGGGVPSDFGLASNSGVAYELDADKITRLNAVNINSLSYFELANSSKLTNIALGIVVSQIMALNLTQTSSSTVGDETSFTFTVSTSIDSKPTAASLQCYVISNNYLSNLTASTSSSGVGSFNVQIPSGVADEAMLVAFARTSFDERITSYAVYNFAGSAQESAPNNEVLTLSPLNYELSFTSNSSDLTVENGYLFTYSYTQALQNLDGTSNCSFPNLIDKSPSVIVVCGQNGGVYFQEWTAYPQVPLKAVSSFHGSEQNAFSYLVTIKGVLYKLQISFGDVPTT